MALTVKEVEVAAACADQYPKRRGDRWFSDAAKESAFTLLKGNHNVKFG